MAERLTTYIHTNEIACDVVLDWVPQAKGWEPLPYITGTLRINVGNVGYVENQHFYWFNNVFYVVTTLLTI